LKTTQDANNLLKNEKLKATDVKSYVLNNILTKTRAVNNVPVDISLKEIAQSITSATNRKFIESSKKSLSSSGRKHFLKKLKFFQTKQSIDQE
jgi:hypothetical protein